MRPRPELGSPRRESESLLIMRRPSSMLSTSIIGKNSQFVELWSSLTQKGV
jgi:hypothetical protein